MWSKFEVAPGVWFFQRDWLSSNHFIALEPRPTLIDTGYKDDFDSTAAAIASLGARPEDVELVVNTHCHCDHAGGNKRLIELSGCDVWMHEREKARIDRRDDIATWWRFHDTWAEFFDVHRGLREGDEIAFGPMTLRVIYAPGHSYGMMMLYCEKRRILFSADAMWQGDLGVINPLVDGEDALERAGETVERIAGFEVETVYPGHGPPITKPQPVINRLMRKLNRYAKDPSLMHFDHLRKMVAYVLLTKGGMREATFLDYLKETVWFPQLVDRYFSSAYRDIYEETIEQVLRNRMIVRNNGYFQGRGSE